MTDISWRSRVTMLLRACGIVAVTCGPAAAQAIGYTASVNGLQGAYPGERIDSVYVFNGVDVEGGPFRLSATVPWMRVESTPETAADGVTQLLLPYTTTGLGDPLLRIDVRVIDDRARALQVGVAGGLKFAVVDAASGRGTGEADFSAGANVFKAVGRTSLMADVLFWKYGDPEGLDFADAWSYSIAAARLLGDGRWSAIASVGGFTAGIGDLPAPAALNVGLVRLIARAQSLGITASFGLNEGSNDFSIGTTWRISRARE